MDSETIMGRLRAVESCESAEQAVRVAVALDPAIAEIATDLYVWDDVSEVVEFCADVWLYNFREPTVGDRVI